MTSDVWGSKEIKSIGNVVGATDSLPDGVMTDCCNSHSFHSNERGNRERRCAQKSEVGVTALDQSCRTLLFRVGSSCIHYETYLASHQTTRSFIFVRFTFPPSEAVSFRYF